MQLQELLEEEDLGESSMFWELCALELALQARGKSLRGQSVHWVVDSQSGITILMVAACDPGVMLLLCASGISCTNSTSDSLGCCILLLRSRSLMTYQRTLTPLSTNSLLITLHSCARGLVLSVWICSLAPSLICLSLSALGIYARTLQLWTLSL